MYPAHGPHAPVPSARFWLITVWLAAVLAVAADGLRWVSGSCAARRRRRRCRRQIDERSSAAGRSTRQGCLAIGTADADALHRPVALRGTLAGRAHGLPRQPADARRARLLRADAAAARGQRASRAGRSAAGCSAISVDRDAAARGADAAPAWSRSTRPHRPAARRSSCTSSARPAAPGRHPAESRPDAFRAETGLPLLTAVACSRPARPPKGLQRDWPAPALRRRKHYGYAFQWLGLAALIAILYVWFQFIAPRRKRRAVA